MVIQLLIGTYLGFQYNSTLANGYNSVTNIRASSFGLFCASFHYWGSALLILHSSIHLLASFVSGIFKESTKAWTASVLAPVFAIAIQMTGNLLPLDKHGVETVVVEAGISSGLPLLGKTVRTQTLAGDVFSQETLNRWWHLHEVVVPILLLGAVLALLSLDLTRFKKTFPWSAVIPFLLLSVVAISVRAPRGAMATEADYGSFSATVSWYTWPLHGLMIAFGNLNPSLAWVGAMAVPGALVVLLLALPFVGRKLTPFSLNIAMGVIALAVFSTALKFGGPIAALTGDRDPKEAAPVATKPAAALSSADLALAAQGKTLFNNAGCSDCHGTDGIKGTSGPSLSDSWKSHNDPAWYEKYIHNPKDIDSGSTMPPIPRLETGPASSTGPVPKPEALSDYGEQAGGAGGVFCAPDEE